MIDKRVSQIKAQTAMRNNTALKIKLAEVLPKDEAIQHLKKRIEETVEQISALHRQEVDLRQKLEARINEVVAEVTK